MKMTFETAIIPEGTKLFELLCYIVLERREITIPKRLLHALVNEKMDIYNLSGEGEKYDSLVLEVKYDSFEHFLEACTKFLCRSQGLPGFVQCTLMFDGVYGGVDSTIECDSPESIYGLATKNIGPVICTDIEILRSEAWNNLLSARGTAEK